MFHSTDTAELSLNVLVEQITALNARIQVLEAKCAEPVGRTDGVAVWRGFALDHNWGRVPFNDWSSDDRGKHPYREARTYTVEELYHAFRTWGDQYYVALPTYT